MTQKVDVMRNIDVKDVTREVKKLCMDANYFLPDDVMASLREQKKKEKWILATNTLGMIVQNAEIAERDMVPMCQDTGMVVVFVEIGQEWIGQASQSFRECPLGVDAVNADAQNLRLMLLVPLVVVGSPMVQDLKLAT